MIKGVNKRIVEITGTQSDFFEKAVLYLRSDNNTTIESRIDLEARAFLSQICPENEEVRKWKPPFIFKLVCAALILAAIAVIICLFIIF